MSEDEAGPIPAGEAANADPDALAGSVTQDEIDDVLNDTALTIAERRARLESLLGRVGEADLSDSGDTYVPFDMRITDALAMLAEGGHDYGARPDPVPEEDEIAAGEGDAVIMPSRR